MTFLSSEHRRRRLRHEGRQLLRDLTLLVRSFGVRPIGPDRRLDQLAARCAPELHGLTTLQVDGDRRFTLMTAPGLFFSHPDWRERLFALKRLADVEHRRVVLVPKSVIVRQPRLSCARKAAREPWRQGGAVEAERRRPTVGRARLGSAAGRRRTSSRAGRGAGAPS